MAISIPKLIGHFDVIDLEQKLLSDDITKLVNDNSVTSEAKNITLGLILLRYTGIDLLDAATTKLRELYKTTIKANLNQIQEIKV